MSKTSGTRRPQICNIGTIRFKPQILLVSFYAQVGYNRLGKELFLAVVGAAALIGFTRHRLS
jgi:hypothetical protein